MAPCSDHTAEEDSMLVRPERPKNGREAGSLLASLFLVFGEKSESGRQQMVVVFIAHVQYAWLFGRGGTEIR